MGKWFWMVTLWFVMLIQPVGVQAEAQPALAQILVNLPSRTLEFYQGDTLLKEYPVAIGKPDTPTPTGSYSVFEKEIDPDWYPPGKGYVVPSGPDNPLGYRWLGFAPLYGIHGTNAPWSIGLAISNGCIRLQEENVEELFALIDYSTPVTIEYERVKVRVNAKGEASIGVYPDVYSRQNVTLAHVKQLLVQAGLDGLVDDSFLQGVIQAGSSRQTVFAQLHNLKINGLQRPERVLEWQGKKLVPVMALADSLDTTVCWDPDKQTLTRQNQTVPGRKLGSTVYVEMEYLPALFGGREVWNTSENCLELVLPVAKWEGQLLTGDIYCINNDFVVPALTLAATMGERVQWYAQTETLLVQGKPAPVIALAGQPFLPISELGELYNTAAVWNEKSQTLDLSYPLHIVDYSMYLNPDDQYLDWDDYRLDYSRFPPLNNDPNSTGNAGTLYSNTAVDSKNH